MYNALDVGVNVSYMCICYECLYEKVNCDIVLLTVRILNTEPTDSCRPILFD